MPTARQLKFPNKKFEIIYADPPWDYKGQKQHAGAKSHDTGGATDHYPTVPTDELATWPVHELADDNCLLFMWTTSPHLDQAISLGKAWGFSWATVGFVWNKIRTNPGFYTLSQCELCLIFKKGKIPEPRGARDVKQLVEVLRTKHSEKPEGIRNKIVNMFPTQKKIELFARTKTKGWCCWGNEV